MNLTHFNSATPGTVDAPLADAFQRITRGMASLAVENHYERTSGALSLFYNWGRHRVDDGYQPLAGETPLDYQFNSKDYMMGLSLYQSATLFRGNRVTAGFDWYRFGGDAWNEYFAGERAGERGTIMGMEQPRVEDELAGVLAKEPSALVVLDPPRAGVAREVIALLLRERPKKIVMISCDPATFARDAGLLTGALAERDGALVKTGMQDGYVLRSVEPFDMFPQTKWVETLAVFELPADRAQSLAQPPSGRAEP